jgi:hypothetical protein
VQRLVGPLVLVDWLDSSIAPRWTTETPASEALKCRTVGWLVHDGKDVKTLAASVTIEDSPQRCCQMTIPAGAILNMRVLK